MTTNRSNLYDVLDMLFASWSGAAALIVTSYAMRGGATFGKDAAGSLLALLGVLAVAGVLGAMAYRALVARLPRPVVTGALFVVALALVPAFVRAVPTIVILV